MKKTLSLTFFALTLTNANAQIEWENISLPDTVETVYSFYAVDSRCYFLGTDHGIYRTNDAGNSWVIEHVSGNNYSCYAIEANNGVYYHAKRMNLYKKHDLNSEWIYKTSALSNIIDIYAPNDSSIFLAHWGGITRSVDSGNTWQLVFEGGPNEVFNSIVQHPNGMLIAGSTNYEPYDTGGVSVSYDNGETWERKGMPYAFVESVAVDSEGSIYAGCYGSGPSGQGGVSKSEDLGETWTGVSDPYHIFSMVITPSDSIYIGCQYSGSPIYMSPNYGQSWESYAFNLTTHIMNDITVGGDGRLYAVISSYDQVVRSNEPVTVGLSNSAINKLGLVVYPNPVGDILSITLHDSHFKYSYEIYRLSGAKVFSKINQRGSSEVDISYLQHGIYILKVILNNQIKNFKIIKIK